MDTDTQYPNGPNIDKILPQIKKGVISSLLACRDSCLQTNNLCHEVFGYDFMVDTSLNVWLLEINSSPSMEYSSPITEKMVKEVLWNLADIANVQ
jgi:tubulin monoglycylase TTLL3/8